MANATDHPANTAWNAIHSAAIRPASPSLQTPSNRPANYAELGEKLRNGAAWDSAWSEFLREFYRFKLASFFALPPPEWMAPGRKALLAGTAEFLSQKFGLVPPTWIDSPRYFLRDLWDPLEAEEIHPVMPQLRQQRIDHTDAAFLRRKVIYEEKNLLCLENSVAARLSSGSSK